MANCTVMLFEQEAMDDCFTLYKMVGSCLKEQFAKQILYLYPCLVYDNDYKVSGDSIRDLLISNLHGPVMLIFEDQEKLENIWCVIESTLRTDVGKDMKDYIKWFRGQMDLKKFFFENLDEIIRLADEKNKKILQAFKNLSRDVDGYAARRLQRQQNVWYHERYNALKTLLDQAKDRKDIPEYTRLYKEITGQEIEIYTKAYSKGILFPPDRDKNKSAEFWFDYN